MASARGGDCKRGGRLRLTPGPRRWPTPKIRQKNVNGIWNQRVEGVQKGHHLPCILGGGGLAQGLGIWAWGGGGVDHFQCSKNFRHIWRQSS